MCVCVCVSETGILILSKRKPIGRATYNIIIDTKMHCRVAKKSLSLILFLNNEALDAKALHDDFHPVSIR
jgi:hypothetical protein